MATSHAKGLYRVGQMLDELVSDSPEHLPVGQAIDDAIKAGLKASIPGLQTDKQVNSVMVKFRPGFTRQLAATVKQLRADHDRGSV